uniref:Transposase (Putative), gypsy type n=1 Tax=Tanacetum cinerariifolium TaxID=118510 RepID=A0A6L2N0X3_TANCI|nr:transposase (putative), gypsy type [Tanacetum cinerariifolium]
MGRDIIQLENAVSIISQEYLLEFTSEYGIPEGLHPELPGPEETIVDFSAGKVGVYTKFFEFANFRIHISQFLFDILGYYQIHLSQLKKHHTVLYKPPGLLEKLEQSIFLGGHISHCHGLAHKRSEGWDANSKLVLRDGYMDLFNFISVMNPTKVKTGTHPRAAHEVPLLTITASRVIDTEDVVATSESSGTPSTIEKSPLDFANEDQPQIITEGMEQKSKLREGGGRHGTTKGTAKEGTTTEILTEDAATAKVNIRFFVGSPELGRTSSIPSMVESPSDFLDQNNITLARQVAMVSQLRLRFEQETKNLKSLLEAEVDIKKSTEAKNVELAKELDSLRAQFSDFQVSNKQFSDQVLNIQVQVMGEEKIKAAFEEFKNYENDKVEQWCAEIDARLDKLSVDFDKELYPHMLTAIAGGHGLRMSEGLNYGIEHGKAGLDLADVKAYDQESNNKLVEALQDLKDLKYPMIDQLEKLKDAPMDLIMASLYLESDTGKDAPQWIRDLRPSSSQLKIPVYPEVRDPEDLWAVKEEILLEDAIAANISWAKKKKKCRVVCRTHGIGFAHHARSDGVPVSAPTVPQGLAILLADAATQTGAADQEKPHLRL